MQSAVEYSLQQLAAAEASLRALGVLRTRNIVGDLAEHIACERLGLIQEPPSTKGYDATDANGLRVQIKGVRLPNRQLSIMRDFADSHFDRLIVVLFDEQYAVRRIFEFDRDEVTRRSSYDQHQRGNRLTLSVRETR